MDRLAATALAGLSRVPWRREGRLRSSGRRHSARSAYGRLGVRGVENWMTELAEDWGRTFSSVPDYQLMSTLFTTTTETRATVYVGVNSTSTGERTTLWVDDFLVVKDSICGE
jgi:hypothetical protein